MFFCKNNNILLLLPCVAMSAGILEATAGLVNATAGLFKQAVTYYVSGKPTPLPSQKEIEEVDYRLTERDTSHGVLLGWEPYEIGLPESVKLTAEQLELLEHALLPDDNSNNAPSMK